METLLANVRLTGSTVMSINCFLLLICACIVIGHLLQRIRWMNEFTTALLIGLCTGGMILLTRETNSLILAFSEDLFFIYLLPPIIFNAGFQVKKKQFFRNFATIMLFGALGTLISFATISLGSIGFLKKMNIGPLAIGDYLAIGAIFSATDSVCTLQVLNQDEMPLLYSLVFGEGVVNDATSIVLFNVIQNFDLSHISPMVFVQILGSFLYLFCLSTVLGVAVGLLSAYIIKKLHFGRHSTDREIAMMILMAYLSYMLAELFNLSAILTVFFNGIVMSHYTCHNVTESSRITAVHAFATLSFISEIFIFIYVGMDAFDIEKWKVVSNSLGTSISVSSILMALILIGRAAFVFPLSLLSNLTKHSSNEKIGIHQQVTIWWSGLMRGAVSMALAYNRFARSGYTEDRQNAILITSTITIVLFSTVVFGLITKPLIRVLLVLNEQNRIMNSESSLSITEPLVVDDGKEDSEADLEANEANSFRFFRSPSYTVHFYWSQFDNFFMRPVFGGRGFVRSAPTLPTQQLLPDSSNSLRTWSSF